MKLDLENLIEIKMPSEKTYFIKLPKMIYDFRYENYIYL